MCGPEEIGHDERTTRGDGGGAMTTPLHQMKAEFFKTLSHPVRIRVLELLSEREHSVGELLHEIEIEASNLSQQLAVLRRAGLVFTRKEGSTVYYCAGQLPDRGSDGCGAFDLDQRVVRAGRAVDDAA